MNSTFGKSKGFPEVIQIAQVIVDVLAVTASFYLGYSFYHYIDIGVGPQPSGLYERLTVFAVLGMLVIFKMVGMYEQEISILNIEEVRKIFKATLIGLLVFFFLTFYMKNISFSRLIITFSAFFMFVIVSLERLFFFKLHLKLLKKGIGVSRVLVYGAGEVGNLLIKRLFHSPGLGYLPIGFMDDNPKKIGTLVVSSSSASSYSLPVLGSLADFEKLVKEMRIDEVFVTITSLSRDRFTEAILKCQKAGVNLRFVPNLFDLKIQKIRVSGVDGIPLISVKEPSVGKIYSFFKRVFDFIFAIFASILLSPIILLIALLIRLDSPGPVIFKQKRVGYKGREFSFYKFRTMWTSVNPYDWTPTTLQDKRITRIGKYLRRMSLDELPQFWNVFTGDMSIVGPRPEMPFIVEQYNEVQRLRLYVRPGITGLWQISADRAKQIHENIEYDLYYIENCGFLMDVVIIVRTLYFAFTGKGAY
ncbi:MAG: exopolysaccharide biosynthesis polyprenyl glycosylphosphotransferase [FCB group bacterium]|nr:exopolysaccharide biosynthesis polyprenyl glycosylphosphotransferase [FCB group bacterium]